MKRPDDDYSIYDDGFFAEEPSSMKEKTAQPMPSLLQENDAPEFLVAQSRYAQPSVLEQNRSYTGNKSGAATQQVTRSNLLLRKMHINLLLREMRIILILAAIILIAFIASYRPYSGDLFFPAHPAQSQQLPH